MELSLAAVLTIFLGGFALHRHRTVLIGIIAALLLGALLAATPLMQWVVHTLDGAFGSLV